MYLFINLFMVYIDTVSTSHYTASRRLINDKLERMLKKMWAAYFKTLPSPKELKIKKPQLG